MDDVRLRPALETDFSTIRRLIHKSGINPTGLDWRRFIVAETSDGQFAGCGQLKPHGDGSLELSSIAIVPEQRGKGIARQVIENLLGKSSRPLYLTCRSSLGPFYEKFGFRSVSFDEMPRYFQRISRIAGIIMTLRMSNQTLLVMRLD